MELVLLAGMGIAGYYIGTNDPAKSPQLVQTKPSQKSNNLDIYDQDGLDIVESKQKKLNEIAYNKSLNPTHTNIIPTSYNKLAPFMREPKPIPNQYLFDPIDIQYSPKEDEDLIWLNMPFKDEGSKKRNRRANKIVGTPNEVFKSNDIDTGHLFLDDEYQMFLSENKKKPYEIPGVQANMNPVRVPKSKSKPNRTANQIIEAFVADPDNPDRDLLEVSELLTDNSDSIRNILSNVNNNLGTPIRLTPNQLAESKRLVGVTPDYTSIYVDDEIASYPAFDRPGQSVKLKKINQPNSPQPSAPTIQSSLTPTPSFLDQFDEQTYDNEGFPSAPNDVYLSSDKSKLDDIHRQLAFQGGWTQYDQTQSMSYGIVPDDQLTHDNQMPFFKEKGGYGSNDLHSTEQMDHNRNLFTGNLMIEWRKKQEIPRLFEPFKDLSYIYGTPVRPEGEESRLFTSRYRNNEKLFQDEKVTPGINLDYNEIGTGGYQSLVRVYPKTVDELRLLSDPKVSYEGRVIGGMKGVERPVQAPVISYKPDCYKTTTEADLLPKTDVNTGPRSRENFIMKETDRSTTSTEYAGNAFNKAEAVDQIGDETIIRPKVKCSTRQNFVLPKPLQKYARDETIHNPNLVSYNIQPNARSDTGQNNHVGPANQTTGPKLSFGDSAKPTLKESMPSIAPLNASNTMRGTVIQMDVAKPTIRQTTDQPLNPNAPSLNTCQKVYYTDPAKQTIRETNSEQSDPINAYGGNNIYANPTDTPRITMAETVVEIPRNTHVLAVGQSQRMPNYTDEARPTLKSDTSQISTQTVITPVNQAQGTTHIQDQLKETIRSTTSTLPQSTFATPVGQALRAPNPQNQLKPTTRETTTNQIQNNFVTPIGQAQRAPNLTDNLRETTKSTTSTLPQSTFVVPVGQAQRAPTFTDHTRTTTRQTIQTPWNTSITPVGQSQRAPNYTDQTRSTTKETTVELFQPTSITPIGQSQRAPNYIDQAKNTIKETTVNLPQNTFIQPINQAQGAVQLQDFARQTIREITTQTPQPNFVQAVGQSQGSVPLQDQLRQTIRQTVTGPQNNFIQAVGQAQRTPNPTDHLRPTIRQTVTGPQNNFVQAVVKAPTPKLTDEARPTLKESTSQIMQNNFIQAVGQSQGSVPLQDQLKTTIREFTTNTKHISGPNTTNGHGYGYIATQVDAPNTNRQFTVQEVYIPPVGGDIKPRDYTDISNAKISDKREVTQQYRYPTPSGMDVGPNANLTQTYLKNDFNLNQSPTPSYSFNNQLDRRQPISTIKSIDQVPLNMFIDPNVLTQLKSNPFSLPAFYGADMSTSNA